MSKHRYSKKKSKGGQKNPNKKWHYLRLDQRERVLQKAANAYIEKRKVLNRPLNKSEKKSLISNLRLGVWVPKKEAYQHLMNEFGHQENLILRDGSDLDEE
ncbi:hypothetical protein ABEW33_27355 [Priestia megaterium]|uniref:hypothetical protein n=1 Tax=Priestia megaterium TaxID=1404 RepID=UPI0030C919FC